MSRSAPIVWLILALALSASLGCGKQLFTRQDLDVEVTKHHINLRWSRIENAALAVHPDLRTAFIEEWSRRAKTVELQDIDVLSVVVDDSQDAARVQTSITWVDRATFALRTTAALERWTRTAEGWRATLPLSLDEAAADQPFVDETPPKRVDRGAPAESSDDHFGQ